ncbi:hypothetical protein KEM55_005743 [Ascosphaera atra]|nr:hypothetical protein KEM55_005743 [Ascosphaera atra]
MSSSIPEDASRSPPSSASSVVITGNRVSLPKRPNGKNGIELQEVVPSNDSLEETEIRSFRVPPSRGKAPEIFSKEPQRPLKWKIVHNKDGNIECAVKPYSDKKRTVMICQSRGVELQGDQRCRYCKAGNGVFKSCVVDVSTKPVAGGACANCQWGKRGHLCTLKKHDVDDSMRGSSESVDGDSEASPSEANALLEKFRSKPSQTTTSKPNAELRGNASVASNASQKQQVVAKHVGSKAKDGHHISNGQSSKNIKELQQHERRRDSTAATTLSSKHEDRKRQSDPCGHGSPTPSPSTHEQPSSRQSAPLDTPPSSKADNHRDDGNIVARHKQPPQEKDSPATDNHGSAQSKDSVPSSSNKAVHSTAADKKTNYFGIPSNLPSKSIKEITIGLQELEQVKSMLGKRKRLLEAVEEDSWDV